MKLECSTAFTRSSGRGQGGFTPQENDTAKLLCLEFLKAQGILRWPKSRSSQANLQCGSILACGLILARQFDNQTRRRLLPRHLLACSQQLDVHDLSRTRRPRCA